MVLIGIPEISSAKLTLFVAGAALVIGVRTLVEIVTTEPFVRRVMTSRARARARVLRRESG